MILLLENTCDKCGYYSETWLSESNIHIKQSCGKCKSYIKFISRNSIPEPSLLKEKIWSLTRQNVELINDYKIKSNFPKREQEYLTNMPLAYYQLYFFIMWDLTSEE